MLELRTDETDLFLCPGASGHGGPCEGQLYLEATHVLWLGTGDDPTSPLSSAHVISLGDADGWEVRCTEGHVLAVGPDDGSGPPPFKLERFLTGQPYADPDPDDFAYLYAKIVRSQVAVVEGFGQADPVLLVAPEHDETKGLDWGEVRAMDPNPRTYWRVEFHAPDAGPVLLIPTGWAPPGWTGRWEDVPVARPQVEG